MSRFWESWHDFVSREHCIFASKIVTQFQNHDTILAASNQKINFSKNAIFTTLNSSKALNQPHTPKSSYECHLINYTLIHPNQFNSIIFIIN